MEGISTAQRRLHAIELDLAHTILKRFRIGEPPLSACTENEQKALLRRGDWEVHIKARTRLTSTQQHFNLQANLEAYEGNLLVFSRH